jgi:prepilin-type N-terminal cleavage/methylation domain-containing protein
MIQKNQTIARNNRGFSLVEFAVVLVIAGFLLVTGLRLYTAYVNDQRVLETYDKQRQIVTSISRFSIAYGRLPCPADPSIPMGQPGFGIEDCSLSPAMVSIGTCTNGTEGLCKVAGERDTPADADALNDPVLIGVIPINSLRSNVTGLNARLDEVSFDSILDPWGYQMSYAVSTYLTDNSTYLSEYGSIAVQTESGTPLTIPSDSGHYVLLSHGDNHAGAYTLNGIKTYPCLASTYDESENCDGDAVFMNGILSKGDNNQYYDDTLNFSSYTISGLWEFVSGTEDIYNLNIGNVGIGLSNPTEKLHVNGNVRSDKLTQKELCSNAGGNCWSPDNIASPTGISCSGTPAPGNFLVAERIVGGDVVCTNVPKSDVLANQTCSPGEFVVGFQSSGAIICDAI